MTEVIHRLEFPPAASAPARLASASVTTATPTATAADPALTARAGSEVLAAARRLADTSRPLLVALELAGAAFGTGPAAAALAAAHEAALADVAATLGRFADAFECDADRLYQVAFALEAAEERSTERGRALGGPR